MDSCGIYLSQLRAMLVRNLLLKKREKRKTTAEIFLPLYTLGILIVIKVLIPNPNYPAMTTRRHEENIFELFNGYKNNTIAVVPNSTETIAFLNSMNTLWLSMWDYPGKLPLNFMIFDTKDDLQAAYWRDPYSIPLAVIFEDSQPITQRLLYEIRTNPSYTSPPSPTELYSAPVTCRKDTSHWMGDVLSIETGGSCPVINYLHSGFLALQMLMDITKIRFDTQNIDVTIPNITLEMFPKEAFTADWMLAFRVVIPLYMVLALSQFITYLLILIVGEKENKIKEGMKIMGLKDSVFWISWFIIYSIFVLLLSAVAVILLFTLQMFQHTHFLPIFLLVVLYSFSVIMFAFMITPFFDKSRTAGVLGNFAVTILSLMYFIQVFVDDSSSISFWLVSLISPTGVALAMDKALVLDLLGEGVNFDNLWSGPGMPFGGSLIMMTLDIFLYASIAYYLDSVIPSEYGTKRHPWFCFTPGFWCQRKVQRVPSSNGESNSFIPGEETSRDVEPVVREMKGREAIRIVDLFKSYQKCRKPEIKAVNGINLTIYEGQITAILGHNGAGKTTLFNILTGLTSPTAGTALIFGYDVRDSNDMQVIRSMTGVCPQHDILFDLLTPREHLEFFAAVRCIPKSMIEYEVKKTLKDIDLVEKADTFAKYLSGGQKRKLSVGIAIIGDPKIIILDEPTAGVDPYSRRQMWSFLQSRRHGKVILLTTHFMDEADILADRKAVISKGRLRCCGSSLFLKNKFGIGYHLTLVLEGNAREHAIARLVSSHVTKAEKARRHGRELSFILPHNSVENFASLFSAIEHEIKTRSSRLGISSYGVSMTTLEEVFLHLEKDEETECTMDNLSKKMVRNRALSRSLSLQSKSTSYQSLQNEGVIVQNDGQAKGAGDLPDGIHNDRNPPVLGLGLDPIKIRPNFLQILYAMLRLRILRLFRNIQLLYFTIIAPLALIILGLYINSIQTVEIKMQSLELNSETYGNKTKILYVNNTKVDITPLMDGINQDVKHVDEYDGNFVSLLKNAPHMAAFNINEYNFPKMNLTIVYNDTMQHSLPILVNVLLNTYYRLVAGKDDVPPIEVKTHPFQQTSQPQEFNVGIASSALFIGMDFVLLPITLAVDMVYDREIKAKNQLRVNGLSFPMYFLSYFIVLVGLMTFICLCIVGIIFLFDVPSLQEPPALITLGALLMLYCPSSILFSTCWSYIFDKMDSAQSILPNIATFLGLIPFLLVVILDMLGVGGTAAFALHVVFSLLNTMYVPFAAVYYVDRVHLMCSINAACHHLTMSDYLTTEIILMAVGVLLHCPLWFFVLLLLDIKKSGGNVSDLFKHFLRNGGSIGEEIMENSDIGDHEDSDVKNERQRVFNLITSPSAQQPPVVLVQNLRKEYRQREAVSCSCCTKREEETTPQMQQKVAVRNLSLAVEPGEVFGLLGHNGAGKTTTMKIIIAEEAATRGRVQIGGSNIHSHIEEAFRQMGYCPQHDAQWKNITVREHLECYAAIRGVPWGEINRIVDLYLSGLQIHEHADKQTQECSGGTRRKLSFAMAMVGGPKVVLMDEPSTGMDPRSKRFLWDTILASFQGGRGAILTTHSMEEADALCSRVGIMVKGELRCIGSTQHLKNLYGAGYTLEMKLLGGDCTPTTPSSDRLSALKEFVAGLFPDATVEESFADRLVFAVPQHAVNSLAECFMQLEKAKQELDIEEYSFSQTTLEQVFLKFSHYDESNSGE
ncbi:PREDICTED: ABC transporter A family member 1-like isoform X1 [Polistes canadensis]|uniref:ABC transporter A family member 1-like isoform X1 n=1 Tax=Polistes canadensis TaxID=91411 RepID=UPI000718FBD3|nr:PREDICTED: ABC transporter A family member 1-like isoform X1 [Polistes canadensis]XP_014610024.1 PREDICTED: ABC transporter A family member 1-like isoform X1 [Polistes canadensis]XP_014610025.1 PREDICTED: ABC transporter A family member 1-like isoform X1 [Polistes canadensis]XP_014610026.1 PREDICTED: ABC transporter A family member 1-like isoform X1 [Polistes canadensis]XP_014610027.1 PREDICTED: ABC transporter A family member 1-like isoform X1 [Polistes canadensis]